MVARRPTDGAGAPEQPAISIVGAGAPPLYRAELWPHRSLSPRGFALVLLGAGVGLAIPLVGLLGQRSFWVIGGFCFVALALLAGFIALTYRSGRLRETISLWPDRLLVERFEPNGARLAWEAHPYWVRVKLHDTHRVEDYLVLSSAGREIELGVFLTPSERRSLAAELERALADIARNG